ncbi:hypothetical protein thsrh120_56850 [Rhizobium sp. No.120]
MFFMEAGKMAGEERGNQHRWRAERNAGNKWSMRCLGQSSNSVCASLHGQRALTHGPTYRGQATGAW